MADVREPTALVAEFLDLLAAGELVRAADLLDEDVLYTNVSLPTMRGRARVLAALERTLGEGRLGFEVYTHSSAVDGSVVLTDRTDVLTYGRVRVQFWVYGRFEIADDRITVWRDSFDWLNLTLALVRGLAGAAIPGLAAKPPG